MHLTLSPQSIPVEFDKPAPAIADWVNALAEAVTIRQEVEAYLHKRGHGIICGSKCTWFAATFTLAWELVAWLERGCHRNIEYNPWLYM
jgi:hypothetical protein